MIKWRGMQRGQNTNTGFTIVELLIVIVVVAILAAISITAYNGIQLRARDAKRASDVSNIMKSLQAYHAVHGTYPQETPTGGPGSFEMSTDTEGTFMEYLKGTYFSEVPVDPINDASHHYRYYVYPISSLTTYGCPTDKGELMIFYAYGFEDIKNKPANDEAVVCAGRTWQGSNTTYFQYAYEKG